MGGVATCFSGVERATRGSDGMQSVAWQRAGSRTGAGQSRRLRTWGKILPHGRLISGRATFFFRRGWIILPCAPASGVDKLFRERDVLVAYRSD